MFTSLKFFFAISILNQYVDISFTDFLTIGKTLDSRVHRFDSDAFIDQVGTVNNESSWGTIIIELIKLKVMLLDCQ